MHSDMANYPFLKPHSFYWLGVLATEHHDLIKLLHSYITSLTDMNFYLVSASVAGLVES